MKKPQGELIDISAILKVESTSSYPRRIDIIFSAWIRPSLSMKYRRTVEEFRYCIDDKPKKMCPLGNAHVRYATTSILPHLSLH